MDLKVSVRERLNPLLGKWRRMQLGHADFTIISNNCWAGHVYRYFNLPYATPTVGLFFYADDYIKFCFNLKHYLKEELLFISYLDSKYKDDLVKRNLVDFPIGTLGDIEVFFLHYHSEDEARVKWNRRKERIHWDNLYFKMSEQNLCSESAILEFDKLPTEKKFVFVTRDYGIASQIIYKDCFCKDEIPNDTRDFRKYIDIIAWLNGHSFKLKQK